MDTLQQCVHAWICSLIILVDIETITCIIYKKRMIQSIKKM